MANYLCKRFPPTTYPLAKVHPLQTDGLTDRRRTITMPIARPLGLLKYGRLKTRKLTHCLNSRISLKRLRRILNQSRHKLLAFPQIASNIFSPKRGCYTNYYYIGLVAKHYQLQQSACRQAGPLKPCNITGVVGNFSHLENSSHLHIVIM